VDSDRQCITVDEQKGNVGHVCLRQQYAREPSGGRVGRTPVMPSSITFGWASTGGVNVRNTTGVAFRQQSWPPSGHLVVSGDAPVTFGLAVIKLKTDGDRFRFKAASRARAVIAVADLTWRM